MATPSPRIAELLAANAEFAKTWTAPPAMKDMRRGDRPRVLVLTCMDPRAVPEQFLGPNCRVAAFRNAGGRATADIVRNVTIARTLGSITNDFTLMVVHHTDCGMLQLTHEEVTANVKARSENAEELIKDIDFGFIGPDDLEASVVSDVKTLKAEELLKGVNVLGYVLDTNSGLLRAVEA